MCGASKTIFEQAIAHPLYKVAVALKSPLSVQASLLSSSQRHFLLKHYQKPRNCIQRVRIPIKAALCTNALPKRHSSETGDEHRSFFRYLRYSSLGVLEIQFFFDGGSQIAPLRFLGSLCLHGKPLEFEIQQRWIQRCAIAYEIKKTSRDSIEARRSRSEENK